jgi:hypothetical protein
VNVLPGAEQVLAPAAILVAPSGLEHGACVAAARVTTVGFAVAVVPPVLAQDESETARQTPTTMYFSMALTLESIVGRNARYGQVLPVCTQPARLALSWRARGG